MKCFWLFLFLFIALCTSAGAANRFAVCTTTCTWDNSSTAMWSTSSGGAAGASAPGVADTAVLDASTCVGGTTCAITVNANLTVASITMGACTASTTGCVLDFSVNNNNVSIVSFIISGTGTRTLRLGSGTFTFTTNASYAVDMSTTTNLTFSAGTSKVVINTTNSSDITVVTFHGGPSTTWYDVTVNSNANYGQLLWLGTSSYHNVTIHGPNWISYVGAGIHAINTLTVTGTISGLANIYYAQWQIVNNGGMTYTWLRGAECTGGGPFAFTNSLNGGSDPLCNITPPTVGTTSACILGGWLLWRDMPEHINDNFPAWLDKAA